MDKHLQLKDGEEFLWKERLPLYINLKNFVWSIVFTLFSFPIYIFMTEAFPDYTQILENAYLTLLGFIALQLIWAIIKSKSVVSIMTTQRIITREGVFMIEEDAVELFQVVDTRLTETLFDRILGRGSIILFTPGDASNPELTLKLVTKPREKMERIRQLSQTERERIGIKIEELLLNARNLSPR